MKSKHDDPSGASDERDPARFRFLGWSFDRLTVRIALATTLLVITPLVAGFYALSGHHFDRSVVAQSRAVELQSRILEVALRHQMMEQDTTLMASILREIGAQPSVRGAMILDHEGEIRIASDPHRVGERIAQDSATCISCHSKSGDERERWIVMGEGDDEVLRSVLPIENRAECHACHAPEERFNGILILDSSMKEFHADLRRDALWFVGGAVLLGLLLLGGVRFLVRRLVLLRLRRLGGAARSIAAGNLADRAEVEGDDVITSLAADFNNMAHTVSSLVIDVREQERQLASIMNSLDDGLVVLDRDQRVVAANRSFSRRLGTYPEAIQGTRLHEAGGSQLPCCAGGGECPSLRCMATGRVQRGVFHSGQAEGSLVEEVHASPVFDEEGEVTQVVEIWRDITERVEEEQRLAEIERLVSLGTLASGFSHEVNTPLASMLTCAESVLAQIDESCADARPVPTTAIREHASIIREQVLRCSRITEQFLRFSRGIPPSIEPIDIDQVVAGVLALVGPTARESRVDIVLNGRQQAVPAVRANAEVVQHVVLNLLVNAIQSCEQGGGTVGLSYIVDEDVAIRIEDDGCGVPHEGRKHLFEPFRSRKQGGTGLGLFLSRSFMRRFGGDVRLVRSEVGVGSCFEIVFARAEVETP